jgi:hypothetical protein
MIGFMFAVKVIKKEELPCGTSSLFLAARDSHQTIPNDIYKKDYLTFVRAIVPQTCCFTIAVQRYSLFFTLYIFEGYLKDFCSL